MTVLLNFSGDTIDLKKGIDIFSKEYNFSNDENGINIYVDKQSELSLRVQRIGQNITIEYSEKIHFFRALGLVLEAMENNNDFCITEHPEFVTNGAMFDVSQGNAVINVKNIKNIIIKMAIMGLNTLLIYTEDNYEVKGEPYFGYMRGRYSQHELKEFNDFAEIFGIEMIPCIQTLAHLVDALKWDCFADIKEDDDTLLVGYEKTYEFIEKMILASSFPFSSKRIHIGMDEAWKLGQGRYLLLNGHKRKFDIMNEHLGKVLEIISRHGLEPMIWSDMYFRAASSDKQNYYEIESEIPDDIKSQVSKEVKLVYWDYEHHTKDFYVEWIKRHREFGSEPIFAGGIWSWNGFGVDYDKTFVTSNAALEACKKEGIKEVFVTIWGDGGTESNIYCNLLGLQLFAEHGYSRELDTQKLKKRFKFCTGANYDDFMAITNIEKTPDMKIKEGFYYTNPSKYIMWQDLLMGLFDKNVEGLGLKDYYRELGTRIVKCIDNNGEYGFIFDFLHKLINVLEIKVELGLEITKAYKDRNLSNLQEISSIKLPELAEKTNILRLFHRKLWMETYKPQGWEVMDIRYGGNLMRIDTAISRISDYVDGQITSIEELEQEKLLFNGESGLVGCNEYKRMPSASRLSL